MAKFGRESDTHSTRSALTRELQYHMERLLKQDDQEFFKGALRDYSAYRSIGKLVMSLNSCLDTPEKMDLLPHIRNLLPKHDIKKFDALAPYSKMASPFNPQQSTRPSEARNGQIPISSTTRNVTVRKEKGTFGFSMRGGIETGLGIFISRVDADSSAERAGLKVGDQLVAANGISLHGMTHASAVNVITASSKVKLQITCKNEIDGEKINRKSFIWVDPKDNQIVSEEPEQVNVDGDGDTVPELISFSDQKKVILQASAGRNLGFSIRGGQEYDLGIYVSHVDKGSQADLRGLKVGDQILEVNGHSFIDILHAEAVSILRTYPNLMMTTKGLGKLPKLPSELSPKRRCSEPVVAGSEGEGVKQRPGDYASSTLPVRGHGRSNPSLQQHSTSLGEFPQLPPHQKSTHHSLKSSHTSEMDYNQSVQLTGITARGSPSAGRERPSKYKDELPRRSNPSKTSSRMVESPTGLRRMDPIRRTHSLKVDNLKISTISEDPMEEEEEDKEEDKKQTSKTQSVSPARPVQRAHSYSGRGVKSRTPLPHTPSPLLVSEKITGIKSPSPSPSYKFQPLNLSNMEMKSNSFPSVLSSEEDPVFAQGMGSQVMHASVSSPSKELLFNEAKKYLTEDEVTAIKSKVHQYHFGILKLKDLTQFFMTLLDTPEKLQLLREIRSVLRANDLVKFDNLVSQREIEAIRVRSSSLSEDSKNSRGDSPHDIKRNLNPLLTEISKGVPLKKSKELSKEIEPDIGMFRDPAAQALVERATSTNIPVRHRESYMAWKDAGNTADAVEVEIAKNAPFLGLIIDGGKDTGRRRIYVKSVVKDGAAYLDGFIQPGFEILQVDRKSLKARTNQEAGNILQTTYASSNPTIRLIVLPPREQ